MQCMAALDIHAKNLNEIDFLSFSLWQEPIWKEANPDFFELAKFARDIKRTARILIGSKK